MKNLKKIIASSLSVISLAISAQNVIPKMSIVRESNVTPIVLQDMHIDIYVVGQTAVTTMEMVFYNPNGRVMEGEFEFPLADGQQVSRFALDIDGRMREGVVVDKARGREAFESVVRRNVDPGLLEKTEGNNFKARIYPMPAKGTRRVLIAFEQELHDRKGKDAYFLPIKSPITLKNFTLKAEIVSRFVEVDTENSLGLSFTHSRNSYLTEVCKTDYTLSDDISLLFPKVEKPQVIVASEGKKTYFYGSLMQPERADEQKTLPKKIVILWDASNSSRKRNFTKEFQLLEAYFRQVQEADIELNTFHIQAGKPEQFTLRNGAWNALKSALEKITYDGATSLKALSFVPDADEYLLFTDGIFNFDTDTDFAELVQRVWKPVYVINSNRTAHPEKLNYLAFATGARYIDLTRNEVEQLAREMMQIPYRLIEVKVLSGQVSDIYPKAKAVVTQRHFTLSGEMFSETATLELSFGYGNKVVQKQTIDIKKETGTDTKRFTLLRRIWAEKNIVQRQIEGRPQTEIDAIGKEYSIVTAGTSLIVLENIADYVHYKIIPPAELQELYYSILKEEETEEKKAAVEKKAEKKQMIEEVIALSNAQTDWWKTDFPVKTEKPDSKKTAHSSNDSSELVEEEIVVAYATRRAASHGVLNEAVASEEVAKIESDLQAVVVTERAPHVSSPKIQLNEWNPETPYLKVLEYADVEKSYETYLKMKIEYGEIPAFYVDAADYFFKNDKKDTALLVISNLAELNLAEAQILRMLGQKLLQYGFTEQCVSIYRKILTIRKEEPQTYRDLGLALAQHKQFDEAVKMLYEVVTHRWDNRFRGIQLIAMNEINAIANANKNVDVSFVEKRLLKNEPVDIRVVLTWDTDNSDMDLWVIDPKEEKCYYSNVLTYLGGKISNDITQGYGPEEFMLKRAIKGSYNVKVNYFSTRSQKQLFPVSLRIEFFTDYGTPAQRRQESVVRLVDQKEVIDVGSFLKE